MILEIGYFGISEFLRSTDADVGSERAMVARELILQAGDMIDGWPGMGNCVIGGWPE